MIVYFSKSKITTWCKLLKAWNGLTHSVIENTADYSNNNLQKIGIQN